MTTFLRTFKYAARFFALTLSFTACVAGATPPANDNFVNSIQLEGTNISVAGNLVEATLEPGEVAPTSGSAGDMIATNSIWYSWVTPVTGRAVFRTIPHWVGQYVRVYTGPDLMHLHAAGVVITASNPSFLAHAGTVYHFQIADYNNASSMTLQIEVVPEVPCDNDNFADAAVLKGTQFSVWYTGGPPPPLHWVLNATTELGEPNHMGATPAKSLWWKWNAPQWGSLYLDTRASTVSNVVLDVYRGQSVESLTWLKKATNLFWPQTVPIEAGETYYISASVPTNAQGDILMEGQLSSPNRTFHPVVGNLLVNPSFEQSFLSLWSKTGSIGGYVGSGNNGVDGGSWPVLGQNVKIWQEFATVPGRTYGIRFALRFGTDLSNGGGARSFRVTWGTNELGIAQIPADEGYFWHWARFTNVATETTSRLTIENLTYNADVDAFSVVDQSAPPQIITQPQSSSTFAGGSATFIVGVTGSAPLTYRWFFDGNVLAGETNNVLALNSVATSATGPYRVVISNSLGSVTSSIANLIVEAPTYPSILWQPQSESVAAGAYVNLTVVAAGTPPLQYQWYFNNVLQPGFTNRFLTLNSVQLTNAGVYKVVVQNNAGSVLSLPATIQVSGTNQGGAMIDFRNRHTGGFGLTNAPIFDVDGFSPLNGSNYLAQLYVGPTLAALRPAGQPTPFYSGFGGGYFVPQMVTLPNIAPGSNAVVQVRAWDRTSGISYEEARALGGKYGRSEIFNLTTTVPPTLPVKLAGLQSFSLHAGLPYFSAGVIRMVEREPRNLVIWAVDGEPNSRYLVEKAVKDFEWEPFVVLTNVTGTVTFSDTANSGAHNVFFRARLLD